MNLKRIKFSSPARSGLHAVVTPANSRCKVARFYRLNLTAGRMKDLESGNLEMNLAVVRGAVRIRRSGRSYRLARLDSLYLPGGESVRLEAIRDAICYIGAAPYEGIGTFLLRRFDPRLPLGAVHQIHGSPPFEREVFMTLDQTAPASRLICGYTWSREGAWTSWPPHQHQEHLEEIYCYFDMQPPAYGLHLCYDRPGDDPRACVVRSGDAVIVPQGYHPTVAIPGSRNIYFWILAAFRPSSRRYDLAQSDPNHVSGRRRGRRRTAP